MKVLEVRQISSSASSELINEIIHQTLEKFGIPSKNFKFLISDAATYMVKSGLFFKNYNNKFVHLHV
jgi:hypothetical protein